MIGTGPQPRPQTSSSLAAGSSVAPASAGITPDTVVAGVPPGDMAQDLFISVQADRGSPATGEAQEAYEALLGLDVSIAFCLAIFHHESQYATDPGAIVVRYGTNNPGNCRSSRTGNYPIVDTEKGQFVAYPDWVSGWVDLSYRLTDPSYVYVQEGRRTIRQIIERFAPASDGNAPESYISAVVADMNAWVGSGGGSVGADIPGWAWIPEGCGEYGYDPTGSHGRHGTTIDRLVIHCSIGTDSLGWLNGCHGNSAHFLDWPDGSKRAQLIRLSDAAWAAGNKSYNLRGIQYEHEATEAEMCDPGYWTDSIIRKMAGNCAEILQVCPGILPDRGHIIGHAEVPDQSHWDPGPVFPWDRFMQAIHEALGGEVYRYFPETGHGIGHGFLDYWEQFHNDQTSIRTFGYPLSEELTEAATGLVIQYFERAVFEFHPENQEPYRVLLRLLGTQALEMAMEAAGHAA